MVSDSTGISDLIDELVTYGTDSGLIIEDDRIFCINRLLELFEEPEYKPSHRAGDKRELHLILEDMIAYAKDKGILKNDTVNGRDLFDTKIMGLITPPPSEIRRDFMSRYKESAKAATDYYYDLSIATNYIRKDRIAKDIKWVAESSFGDIDITINLSKPEKDPKDIANALNAPKSGYPLCLLCRENEGYSGTYTHPARQNHRIIPIKLCGQSYYLQYSPYVYYNEHCIVFNEEHTPMKIDEDAFAKLLDFIQAFPHYTIGSNADLPIVGGSILTHDHFQGGSYEFPMVRADYMKTFTIEGYENIKAGIIKWPLSTIRLRSSDMAKLVKCCTMILEKWRNYTDEKSFIFAWTYEDGEKVPHNTITPIARMRGDLYEMDLVLRNNITTEEHPLGVYHPHSEYHHIKKENIGLIEVMGMAILPARLSDELGNIEKLIKDHIEEDADQAVSHICEGLEADEKLRIHAEWIKEILQRDIDGLRTQSRQDESAISRYIRQETGTVFAHVLENAGVYKQTQDGMEAFERFINVIASQTI
ncbi:MAG: UDP-glucose--hexose-1-phosphate uridylyltransferase [Lachnospiraceae bacterium]|nr:UDP-glucose--hexose-1-phosphate uridylyltransferase [Lachnospiraceae bacterium]